MGEMIIKPVAGRIVPRHMLIDVGKLRSDYYMVKAKPIKLTPDGRPEYVEFGTSGHRGSTFKGTFNEDHILAITRAICEHRKANEITGPLFMGFDTHALSIPAFQTALEVLVANGVEVVVHQNDEFTPTPVISRMILKHNGERKAQLADGIIITPSHNGPQDGGFKYNPTHAGPADIDVTNWIQDRANQIIRDGLEDVKRATYEAARQSRLVREADFIDPYVTDLATVIDLRAIREAGVRIGADPMGGSGIHFWPVIAERYGLKLEVTNNVIDPAFSFMPLDTDLTIRMDCSSADAMASLIALAGKYDIGIGNDTDFDRHGIVTPLGLMNPNHYLSVAIWYLLQNRPAWSNTLKIGKTLVSSSMIDKVAAGLARELYEVPVGFKWFVEGLLKGTLAFGGEESAGASFLRRNGETWVTEKDGFIMGLLAAEILAVTGKTPEEIYCNILVPKYGDPYYKRADGPITDAQKKILKALQPSSITATTVAGLKIESIMTAAPGNNAPIGGVKAVLADGSWFAIRPSGTEPKMKVYIESFGGEDLWRRIYTEAAPLIFGAAA